MLDDPDTCFADVSSDFQQMWIFPLLVLSVEGRLRVLVFKFIRIHHFLYEANIVLFEMNIGFFGYTLHGGTVNIGGWQGEGFLCAGRKDSQKKEKVHGPA